MPEENKATLQKANAAIAAGDTEAFLAYCSDDTEWTMVGDRVVRGKDAVRQYLTAVYAKPPRFSVADLIAEDDLVTAVGEITITDRDGKETDYSYCDVWRFRDGKMVELRAFVIEAGAGSS